MKAAKKARKKRPANPSKAETPSLQERTKLRTVAVVILVGLVGLAALFFAGKRYSDHAVTEAASMIRMHQYDEALQRLLDAEQLGFNRDIVSILRSRVAWIRGDIAEFDQRVADAKAAGVTSRQIEFEQDLSKIRQGASRAYRSQLPKMLSRFPDEGPTTLQAFTMGFLATGDVDGAAEVLAIWQDAEAKSPSVHYWIGIMHQTYGSDDDAINSFRTALQHSPEIHVVRQSLADMLQKDLFYVAAEKHYAYLVQKNWGGQKVQAGLAICQLKCDKTADAVQRIESLLASGSNNTEMIVLYAEHLLANDQNAKAIEVVQPIADQQVDFAIQYILATANTRLGNHEVAKQQFDYFAKRNRLFERTQMMKLRYDAEPSAGLAKQIAKNLMACRIQDASKWILIAGSSQSADEESRTMLRKYLERTK